MGYCPDRGDGERSCGGLGFEKYLNVQIGKVARIDIDAIDLFCRLFQVEEDALNGDLCPCTFVVAVLETGMRSAHVAASVWSRLAIKLCFDAFNPIHL